MIVIYFDETKMWQGFSNKKLMIPKWDYSKPKREEGELKIKN
jgi:hypothetical protein